MSSTSSFGILRTYVCLTGKFTVQSHLGLSFVSPQGSHDSLKLRRILDQARLRDALEDGMEVAGENRAIPAFHAESRTYS